MELLRAVKDAGTRLLRRQDRLPPTDLERQRHFADLNVLVAPKHNPTKSRAIAIPHQGNGVLNNAANIQPPQERISWGQNLRGARMSEASSTTGNPLNESALRLSDSQVSTSSKTSTARTTSTVASSGTIKTRGTTSTVATTSTTVTTTSAATATPAKTSVTTARLTPIIKTDFVYEMERGLFIAPHISIDQIHHDRFKEICCRLDDTLQHTFQPKGEADAALSYEFMMAGPSASRFKPAVLVICCSESHKKQLKAILKRQKWILDYDYFWQVIVDPVEKLSGWVPAASEQENFDIFGPSSWGSETLCGMPAVASMGDEGNSRPAFTVGGVITVAGKAFALTAGHPFRRSAAKRDGKVPYGAVPEEDEGSLYSNDSDSMSPFSFSDSTGEVRIVEAANVIESNELSARHGGRGMPTAIPFNEALKIGTLWLPPVDKYPLDWAIIELSKRQPSPNEIQIPGGRLPVSIDEILGKDCSLRGPVWVIGGVSGVVKGSIYEIPATLRLDGRSFEAWQIKLSKSPSRGDSGAWVIQNNTLCGHVIAGREGVPWVYMIRIDKILDDVKMWMKSPEVGFPIYERPMSIDAFRKKDGTRTSPLFGHDHHRVRRDYSPQLRTINIDSLAGSTRLSPRPRPARPSASLNAASLNDSATICPSVDDDDLDGFFSLSKPWRAGSDRTWVEQEPMICVRGRLERYNYTAGDLADHINAVSEDKTDDLAGAFDYLWSRKGKMTPEELLDEVFEYSESATAELYDITREPNTTYPPEIAYEIKNRCNLNSSQTLDLDEPLIKDVDFWNEVRRLDSDDTAGRITILTEPAPSLLAGIHLVMRDHFDMNELLGHLTGSHGNQSKTLAYMTRAYELTPTRRRSFFFVFRYYTVVGEGLMPAPWQAYDSRPPDMRSPDHIDIAEGSSILAVSLGGRPTKTIKSRTGRGRTQGSLFDSSGPWHLLNIQHFPDDNHTSREPFIAPLNGPFAFLEALASEYRDAVTRYGNLTSMIEKLVTPPTQFMFDASLREKLLFEDRHCTYSKRYFWAYNTLGVLNDGIAAMIAAYTRTFTGKFWAGEHPTLWPDLFGEPSIHQATIFRLKTELEDEVAALDKIKQRNEAVRTEICSLREQLFSSSSVKKSRRAIEQGRHIKVLTMVSIVFLPLTFATSVFGITALDITPQDWRFAVTIVCISFPFLLLITFLPLRALVRVRDKVQQWFASRHIEVASASVGRLRRRNGKSMTEEKTTQAMLAKKERKSSTTSGMMG